MANSDTQAGESSYVMVQQPDYGDLYTQRIKDLGSEDVALLRQTLSMILVQERPLATSELCDLLSVGRATRYSTSHISEICAGFIKTKGKQPEVILADSTVKTILQDQTSDFQLPQMHAAMFMSCYLYLEQVRQGAMTETEFRREQYRRGPAGHYAAFKTFHHASQACALGAGSIIEIELMNLLCEVPEMFERWRLAASRRFGFTGRAPYDWKELYDKHGRAGFAAQYGLIRPLQCFIERSAEHQDQTKMLLGLLRIDIEHGQPAVVDTILSHLPTPSSEEQGGLLCHAVQHNRPEIACRFLDAGFALLPQDSYNTFGSPIRIDDQELVQRLIDSCRPEARQRAINEALYWAAVNGSRSCAVRLLDQAVAPLGTSVLHAAVRRGKAPLVQMILDKGVNLHGLEDEQDIFMTATNHPELIGMLVQAGADINKATSRFGTPLHWAASRSTVKAVKALLQHGANVNSSDALYDCAMLDERQQDFKIGTPLAAAAVSGQQEIVYELIRQGADVDLRDLNGVTALQAASLWGQIRAVEVLLEHNADPMLASELYGSALDAAMIVDESALKISVARAQLHACYDQHTVQLAAWMVRICVIHQLLMSVYGHRDIKSVEQRIQEVRQQGRELEVKDRTLLANFLADSIKRKGIVRELDVILPSQREHRALSIADCLRILDSEDTEMVVADATVEIMSLDFEICCEFAGFLQRTVGKTREDDITQGGEGDDVEGQENAFVGAVPIEVAVMDTFIDVKRWEYIPGGTADESGAGCVAGE